MTLSWKEKLIALALAAMLSAAAWHALRPRPSDSYQAPDPTVVPAATAPGHPCRGHGRITQVTDTPGSDIVGARHLYTATCLDGYVVSEGSNR